MAIRQTYLLTALTLLFVDSVCIEAATGSSTAAFDRQLLQHNGPQSTDATAQHEPNFKSYTSIISGAVPIADGADASSAAVGLSVARSTAGTQQASNKPTPPSISLASLHHPEIDETSSIKPLWPLDGIDFAVLAIITFSLSLAGGAGIGGGAILVPIYLMLRGEQACCVDSIFICIQAQQLAGYFVNAAASGH